MTLPARQFLRELLESEDGQRRIKKLWEAATDEQVREKSDWVTCRECKHRTQHTFTYKAHSIKDAASILSLAATYGVGKPPEEKRVDVNITARRLEDATDDELRAIYEGHVRAELPAGS